MDMVQYQLQNGKEQDKYKGMDLLEKSSFRWHFATDYGIQILSDPGKKTYGYGGISVTKQKGARVVHVLWIVICSISYKMKRSKRIKEWICLRNLSLQMAFGCGLWNPNPK